MNDDEKTEVIDFRLPKATVEQLTRSTLMRLLEQLWLDAFCRGAEFGMTLVSNAKKAVAEGKRKKRRSKKRA